MNYDMDMCDARIGGGELCPLRHDCFRYLNGQEASGDPLGWWFKIAPYRDGKCELQIKTNRQ